METVESNVVGTSNVVSDKWSEVKTLVESIELDVLKNARGNSSAGVRARKGLRLLKKVASELVKATSAGDKVNKEVKHKEKALRPKKVATSAVVKVAKVKAPKAPKTA